MGRLRLAVAAMFLTLLAVAGLFTGYLLMVKAEVLPGPGPVDLAVVLTAGTIAAAVVAHTVLIRRGRLSYRQLGFARPTSRLLHLLWQAPLTVVVCGAVGSGVLKLTTGSASRSGKGTDFVEFGAAGPGVVVAVLVAGVVVTPLWEEALFRGAFFLGFHRLLGPIGAVVGSAAVFAGFHVLPALWAFVFPLGLCLGWLRWFHRSTWASVGVHGFNNLLAITAVLLAP